MESLNKIKGTLCTTIQNRCRACLGECVDGYSLDDYLTFESENYTLLQLIEKITSIKVINNVVLPNRICKDCTEVIENSFIFLKRFELATNQLENFMKESDDSRLSSSKISDFEIETENLVKPVIPLRGRRNTGIYCIITEDGGFKCSKCGHISKTKSSYRYHKRTHHEKQYMCDVCPKTFPDNNRLVDHARKHNTTERNFICSKCGQTFRYRKSLDYHLITHDSNSKCVCQICDKVYANKILLQRHVASNHLNQRKFVCQFCGKTLALKAALAEHEMIHTGERPHVCSHCKKGFVKISNLKQHLATHSGPHRCLKCRRTFLTEEYLQQHELKRHFSGAKNEAVPTMEKEPQQSKFDDLVSKMDFKSDFKVDADNIDNVDFTDVQDIVDYQHTSILTVVGDTLCDDGTSQTMVSWCEDVAI